jgi:hypothetical protein
MEVTADVINIFINDAVVQDDMMLLLIPMNLPSSLVVDHNLT